jgi:hypothetical protein
MFVAVILTIAKMKKLPKCPTTNEWIRKCDIDTTFYYSVRK